MKVIVCIAGQKIAPSILETLEVHQFRVTQLVSKGGFLKRGNVTYLIGVENEEVDKALSLIEEEGQRHGKDASSYRVHTFVCDAQPGSHFIHATN